MKTDDIILTIAIPTYNRKQFLINNIRQLLPQLNDQTKLLIIDNCSKEIMQDVLCIEFVDIQKKNVEFIRNRVNIGADANVVRCFENCTSPYLWILGDDDIPVKDAVTKIIYNIKKYPEIIFFNYSSEIYFRNKNINTKGIFDFVENIDNYSNLLFISNNIYKLDKFIDNLIFAYRHIYSCASQIAILIESLSEDSETQFSKEQIVTWGMPTEENKWSFVIQSFGYNSLLELPVIVNNGLSKKLGLKMKTNSPSIKTFFRLILMLTDSPKYDYLTRKYLFNQIIFRKFYFHPFYIRILRSPMSFMLKFPRTITFSYKYICLISGKERTYIKDSIYN